MEQVTEKYKNGSKVSHLYPEHPDGFYTAYLVTDETNDGYRYTHFGTNANGYIFLDSTLLSRNDMAEIHKLLGPWLDFNFTTDKFGRHTYSKRNSEVGEYFKYIAGKDFIYLATEIIPEDYIHEIEAILDLDSKFIK